MGRFLAYLLLAVNAFLVGMMVLCAYSPCLNPRLSPLASCLGLAFPLFLCAALAFLLLWLFVKRRYALLPLAGLLVCLPQIHTYVPLHFAAEEVPREHVKLLSYNIMAFGGMKKSGGTNPILDYLAGSGADIICLQEYAVSANPEFVTRQDVRKALSMYPYSTVDQVRKGGTQLACFSKFPILSVQKVPYESTANGSMAYTLKVGADTLLLVNNHLESNKFTREDRGLYEDLIDNPDAQKVKERLRPFLQKLASATAIRAAQADSLARLVDTTPCSSVVVCGDFNDVSISYAHRVLARRLHDAFTDSGCGLGISYNQNKFYFRIDHILVSPNLKTYSCTVDNSVRASDHYPIWCYLSK